MTNLSHDCNRGVKARTINLSITHCSLLLLSALVYEDHGGRNSSVGSDAASRVRPSKEPPGRGDFSLGVNIVSESDFIP